MTIAVQADMTQGERLVEALTTRLLATLANLRTAWHTIGVKVQEHIAERWTSGYSSMAPLADSTLYRKAKRLGYYRQSRGTGAFMRRGRYGFWWTGKAMARALGTDAFEATNRSLVIDFGRDSEPRRNLERMHFGANKRPARPVYDIDQVASIAQEWMDKFVTATLNVSNFGTVSVRRS
jgi:hypothetical protein